MSTNSSAPEGPKTFVFPEEPLGLPTSEGFGLFQGTPLGVLGPGSRFHLQAKLGSGTNSSVWLAKAGSLHGIKILSGYASELHAKGLIREFAVYERLASLPVEDSKHRNRLITHFKHKGIDQDGEHICLALELERMDLQSVWNAKKPEFYPIPIVKHILRHMLHGIAALHKSGVVHTDIKPDNIIVSMAPSWSDEAVSTWVSNHPARVYDPVQSLDKVVTVFVSEESPLPTVEELETCDFKIGDFSNGALSFQPTDSLLSFLQRRSYTIGQRMTLRRSHYVLPKFFLGGGWTETVDIWTFGCLVFTILTKAHLFPDKIRPNHIRALRPGIDPNAEGIDVDYLLWSVVNITEQIFPLRMLSYYEGSPKYFESNGEMKRFGPYGLWSLEQCIRDTGCPASDEDIAGACALMRRCLKYAPLARASAQELLEDPWLKDADV